MQAVEKIPLFTDLTNEESTASSGGYLSLGPGVYWGTSYDFYPYTPYYGYGIYEMPPDLKDRVLRLYDTLLKSANQ